MTRPIRNLFISAIVCLVWCMADPGAAFLFRETFDTDVANTAEFRATYPHITTKLFRGNGQPPLADDVVSVRDGVLWVDMGNSFASQLTIPGYSEEIYISADIGALNSDGYYNVGMVFGQPEENTISFHPGFTGYDDYGYWLGGPGALRVNGRGGFGNKDMGFLPENGVLHHMEVHQLPGGTFDITVTDGENSANVFTTSWTNDRAFGREIGLQRSGALELDTQTGEWVEGPGFGLFDNFTVSLPPSCDIDLDEVCNVNDINLMFMQGDLVAGVADPNGTSPFNLNGDTSIDGQDISQWLGLAAEKNGYGTAPYLRGDTNHLGNISPAQRTVDITDFNALASNYAPQGTPSGIFAKNWHLGNFDGDGDIDLTDFNFLAGNYDTNGYGAGQAGAAPEPTTSLLLAIGGLFVAAAASARWVSR